MSVDKPHVREALRAEDRKRRL